MTSEIHFVRQCPSWWIVSCLCICICFFIIHLGTGYIRFGTRYPGVWKEQLWKAEKPSKNDDCSWRFPQKDPLDSICEHVWFHPVLIVKIRPFIYMHLQYIIPWLLVPRTTLSLLYLWWCGVKSNDSFATITPLVLQTTAIIFNQHGLPYSYSICYLHIFLMLGFASALM
jgi:hypothetical protein